MAYKDRNGFNLKMQRPVGGRAFGQLTSPYSLGLTVARKYVLRILRMCVVRQGTQKGWRARKVEVLTVVL